MSYEIVLYVLLMHSHSPVTQGAGDGDEWMSVVLGAEGVECGWRNPTSLMRTIMVFRFLTAIDRIVVPTMSSCRPLMSTNIIGQHGKNLLQILQITP